MRRSAGLLLLTVAAMAGSGCAGSPEPSQDEELTVVVSILPQRWVVETLAGPDAHVEVLVGPGQSPATYEPTPRQLTALAGADLYVRVGVPFENTLMEKIGRTVPGLEVVDGREGVELVPMAGAGGGGHDHEHAEGDPDPHFWLDPARLAAHAATVADALARVHPADAAGIRERLAEVEQQLAAADARVTTILEPVRGCSVYVFHPAWGYLTRRYGLRQVAIAAEGKDPGARRLASLVEQARDDHVSALFVQPQFRSPTVEVMADALGAEVVTLDPLAEDVPANLERMASRIAAACGP